MRRKGLHPSCGLSGGKGRKAEGAENRKQGFHERFSTFCLQESQATSDFAEDIVEIGGAGGEVGVDGAEFAAVNDELGAEVDEGFGIGGGADWTASAFAVFFAGGGDSLLHVHHDGIVIDAGGVQPRRRTCRQGR